ncbi:MAG: acyl-CoA reductase, partial [Bacteroidota bacterium]|nr:acyl-CoA reductase [Bacteroidota bacterium]
KINEWNEEFIPYASVAETLKHCDAYIATGSNNSSRYFEYYFAKYPHIIRKNKTAVALLYGDETDEELSLLADDVSLYFGLGCRNVTKLFVPEGYDFIPVLEALKKYNYFLDLNKYKNNYDYGFALLIMSGRFYMNNGSILLAENASPFAPVAQLNFGYYNSIKETNSILQNNSDVQCIVGHQHTPFGNAQKPSFADFADGTDTLQFLMNL